MGASRAGRALPQLPSRAVTHHSVFQIAILAQQTTVTLITFSNSLHNGELVCAEHSLLSINRQCDIKDLGSNPG